MTASRDHQAHKHPDDRPDECAGRHAYSPAQYAATSDPGHSSDCAARHAARCRPGYARAALTPDLESTTIMYKRLQ